MLGQLQGSCSLGWRDFERTSVLGWILMCVRICSAYVLLVSVDLNCRDRGSCKTVLGGWEVKKMEYAALTSSIMGICER